MRCEIRPAALAGLNACDRRIVDDEPSCRCDWQNQFLPLDEVNRLDGRPCSPIILHGLYVFRAIDDFLTALLEHTSIDNPQHRYLIGRRATIKNEIATTIGFEDCRDLTFWGRRVVLNLLAPSSSA
jgi:hypothetical protein